MRLLRIHVGAVIAIALGGALTIGTTAFLWPHQSKPMLTMSVVADLRSGDETEALHLEALYDNQGIGAWRIEIRSERARVELNRADLTPAAGEAARLAPTELRRTLGFGEDARASSLAVDLSDGLRCILTQPSTEDGSPPVRAWDSSPSHDSGLWYRTAFGVKAYGAGVARPR